MIFVAKESKELLEQHLGDYATWMPYGFGEKGMLGLYPTNEHTEEEIITELKKYKIPYYTEATEAVVLSESGNDEADESYKGIFIDRKTGDFKILTGRFPDKKAMINKYGTLGKDYIARKVFEKPVFDWILNNAQSSLDSYLMFSTAFSKWRHNSILDKYYMKLINDMPQLFKNVRAQDKIGGDNKAKNADKEAVEFDEAQFIGSPDDMNHGKIFLVVYDENGNVLADFTERAPIKYSRNQYDFESVELYDWMDKAVKQAEKETGEKAAGVAVKTSKRDASPKFYTCDQIEKGYTRDAGRLYSQDDDRVQSPDEEKLKTLIYCRDEEGRKIIPRPYPTIVNQIIEKGKGIDDRQVWISAQQALASVDAALGREPQDSDEVFIVDPKTGDEYVANRRSVNTNVHNMEPNQKKPWLTKSGNVAHPTWSKYKITGSQKDIFNTLKQRQKSVVYDTPGYNPPRKQPKMTVGNGDRDQVRSWIPVESTEVREEIKQLIEASGIYDLPDYQAKTDVIVLRAKNDLGKDDTETLNLNIESPDALAQIEAAAKKLKSRNIGKKIFFQLNDEPEEEYGM